MAAVVFGGAAAANAAWWTGTYYPSTRSTYYRAQPYYAYYGAAYAPAVAAPAMAAPAVCETCKPATCGTCVQRVCSYVPQTTYQVAYRDVPVTSYHPVTTLDHCSGCTWTSYRPVTTCTKQAYYIPQTTYRPVCTNVAIARAPVATAYYQAPVVAAPAAPCGGCATAAAAPATVTPGVYNAPVTAPASPAPAGSGVPQPQIEPTTPVPNSGGESILQESQTRAAKPVAPAQSTGNNWKFGGPSNEPTPVQQAPRDRTAMTQGNREAAYAPVSLSTAKIQPAGNSAKVVDANGWEAVK
jgi:hypothetical protein